MTGHTVAKIFQDKDGKVAIWQWPNAPLWLWIVATVVTHFVHQSDLHMVSSGIASAALIVWAGLEIYSGASLFRRLLGGVVLAAILLSFARRLLS